MFSRILCGVDFSPMSVSAFEAGVELARLADSDLHVVHVIEAHPRAAFPQPLDDVTDGPVSLEEQAARAMDALVQGSSPALEGIRLTTEITTGVAVTELVGRARDSSRDLIVVGARGVTLLEDAVFGSTAEHLVKEAPCSVLVVRNQPRA